MNPIEKRFIKQPNQTTVIERVQRVDTAVPYGMWQREVLLGVSTRIDPSPRTLTRAQRKELREQHRVGGRQNASIEQRDMLRSQIATAHNRVVIAKAQLLGSDDHECAIIKFAQIIADHPQALETARDLAGSQ